MYEKIKRIVKESLNGYMLISHSERIAEKVTNSLINAGVVKTKDIIKN